MRRLGTRRRLATILVSLSMFATGLPLASAAHQVDASIFPNHLMGPLSPETVTTFALDVTTSVEIGEAQHIRIKLPLELNAEIVNQPPPPVGYVVNFGEEDGRQIVEFVGLRQSGTTQFLLSLNSTSVVDETLLTFDVSASPVAGSEAHFAPSASPVKVYIDSTAPVIDIFSTDLDPSTWYNASSVEVAWNASDPGCPSEFGIDCSLSIILELFRDLEPRGSATFDANGTFELPIPSGVDGIFTVELSIEDAAGNGASASPRTVKIDRVAPMTANATAPAEPATGWFTGDFTVTLSCSDATSFCAFTNHSLDGGAAGSSAGVPVTIPVSGEGEHALSFFSTDVAGNVEALQTPTFRLDSVAPTTTLTTVPASGDGANDWFNSTVEVSLACADGGAAQTSGCGSMFFRIDEGENVSYSGPFGLPADGEYTISYFSKDVALNVEDLRTVEIKQDRVAPVITAIAANPTLSSVGDVLITFESTELLSELVLGPASVELVSDALGGPVASASAVWTGQYAYIFGGQTGSGASPGFTNAITRYDPATGTATTMEARLPTARGGTGAAWDGTHAYIFGGTAGGPGSGDDILRYDPATDTLATLSTSLPWTVGWPSVVWNGTHFLIFGGSGSGPSGPTGHYDQVLRFDPSSGVVTVMGAVLPSGRDTTSAIWDGRHAYIFGGNGGVVANNIVRYDPYTDAILNLSADLPDDPWGLGAVWSGKYAYLFGGWSNIVSRPDDVIYRYDPAEDELTELSATLPSPRAEAGAVWTGTEVLILGGYNAVIAFDEAVHFNEPVQPGRSVTVNGNNAAFVSESGGTYFFDYTVTGVDDQGEAIVGVVARDSAGNDVSIADLSLLFIDTVAPTTTNATSGTVGENDWYTSCVGVVLSPTDPSPASGINFTRSTVNGADPSLELSRSVCGDSSSHQFAYESEDLAGNLESSQTIDFKIDKIPPTTTANLTGSLGENNTWISHVTVNLTATAGPSGLRAITYFLDGVGPTAYSSPFVVSGTATHVLEYFSTAENGLNETHRFENLIIDMIGPVTNSSLTGSTIVQDDTFVTSVVVTLFPETDATASYSLDGAPYVTYSGPFNVTTDGAHSVAFFSTDTAGHVEATKYRNFSIDTTPPALTGATAIPRIAKAGTVNLTLDVSEALFELPQVTVNGAPATYVSNTTTVFQFRYVVATGEGQGNATIRITGKDLAGNDLTGLDSSALVVDTAAPVTALVTSPGLADGGAGWFVTFPSVTLACVDAVSGCASTNYKIDDGAYALYTGPFDITSDGIFDVSYASTDAAGNVESPRTSTIKVDTTPPDATDDHPANGTWVGSSPSITLSLEQPAGAVERSDAAIRFTTNGTIPTALTGTLYGGAVAAFTDGSTILKYVAFDAAGNVGPLHSTVVKLDTLAPDSTDDFNANGSWVNAPPRVGLSLAEADTGVERSPASIRFSTDGVVPSATTGNLYLSNFTISSEGNTTVKYVAFDEAGNVGDVHSLLVKLDSVDPTVAITAPSQGEFLGSRDVGLSFVKDGTGSEIASILCSINGEAQPACLGTFHLEEDGVHSITIVVTDEAGNQDDDSVTFTVDTLAPDLDILEPSEGSFLNSSTVGFLFDASDALSGLAVVECSGGASFAACLSGDQFTFEDGSRALTVRAADRSGNVAERVVEFTVDTGLPSFSGFEVTPPLAKEGIVSIAFDSSEALKETPEVTVNGRAAEYVDDDGLRYLFDFEVVQGDIQGSSEIGVSGRDFAHNVGTFTSTALLTIDTLEPTTEVSFSGTGGDNGWFVGCVDVAFAAADEAVPGYAGSGISGTFYAFDEAPSVNSYDGTPPEVCEDRRHTVAFYSVDVAGNEEEAEVAFFDIDAERPRTGRTTSADIGDNGIYVSPVTFELEGTGGPSFIGTRAFLDGIEVALEGSPSSVGFDYEFTTSFTATGDGVYRLEYFSESENGLEETPAVFDFEIDTTPPGTTSVLRGDTKSDATRFVTPVVIHFLHDDDVVGTTYSLDGAPPVEWDGEPFTVSGEGPHVLEYYSTDRAGLQEEKKARGFIVDTLPPVFTLVSASPEVATTGKVTITVDVDEEVQAVPTLSLNGKTLAGLASPTIPNRFVYTYDVTKRDQQGVALIRLEATDLAGLHALHNDTTALLIDTQLPTLRILSPRAGEAIPTKNVTFTFADGGTGSEIVSRECSSSSVADFRACNSGDAFTFPRSGAGRLTLRVADRAGNALTDAVPFSMHGTVSRIELSPPQARVVVPGALNFRAIGVDEDGVTVPSARFVWKVSDERVAAVNPATGALRALADGTVVVRATHAETGVFGEASVEALTRSMLVKRIDIDPKDSTITADEDAIFAVTGYDENEEAVSGIEATFSVENATVGSFTRPGAFAGFRTGTTSVTARVGQATSTTNVTVTSGRPAQLEITPATATTSANGSIQFFATGLDSKRNVVTLGVVSWQVDNPTLAKIDPETGLLNVTGDSGTVLVAASSSGLTRTATVYVTTVRAEAANATALNATVVKTEVADQRSLSYAVGVASAETGSRLEIGTPPVNETLVSMGDAKITIGVNATNLAIILGTQPGRLEFVPDEVDAGNLTDLISGLLTAPDPAMFFTVQATVNGSRLGSADLNSLLGEVNTTFNVDASYFAEHALDPARARLAEYSEGRLVRDDVPAVLLTPSPVDGFYTYGVSLRSFSSFALISLEPPLASIGVTGPDAVVAGQTAVYQLSGANRLGNWAPLSTYLLAFAAPTRSGGYDVCYSEGTVVGCKRVNVVADVLASIMVSGPQYVPTGSTMRYTLSGFDQFGNTVPLARGEIDFSAPKEPGKTTFTYSELGITGTFVADVVAGLARITIAPIGVAIPAGGQLALRAAGADAYGNFVPVSPRWSSTCGQVDANGLFRAPETVGQCIVRATAGVVVGEISLSVVSTALGSIELVAPSEEVRAGESLVITARGLDLFGNEAALSPALGFSWSTDCGTISPAGVFTAPTVTGVCNVVVTQLSVASTIAIKILPGPLAKLALTPSRATVLAQERVEFAVDSRDEFGNPLDLPATFSAIRGSFAGAIYIAPALPGDDLVTATVGLVNATASVRVLPNSAIATQSVDSTRGTLGYYSEAYKARSAHREDYPAAWQRAEIAGDAGTDYLESGAQQAYLYGTFRATPTPVDVAGARLSAKNPLGGTTSLLEGGVEHTLGAQRLSSLPPVGASVGLTPIDVSGLSAKVATSDDLDDGILVVRQEITSGTASVSRTLTLLEGTLHADVRTQLTAGSGDLVTLDSVAEVLAPADSWLATTAPDGTIRAMPIEDADGLEFDLEGRPNRWFAVYDPDTTEVAGVVLSGDIATTKLIVADGRLRLETRHSGATEVLAAEYFLAYEVKSRAATRYAGIMELARQDADEIGVVFLASDRAAGVGWAGSRAEIEVAVEEGLNDWWSGLNGVEDTWTIGVFAGREQASKPVRLILSAEKMRRGGIELALDGVALGSADVGAAADDTSLIITLPIPHFSLRTVQIKTVVPGVPPIFMWLTLALGAVVGGESMVLGRMVLRSRAARRGAYEDDDGISGPVAGPHGPSPGPAPGLQARSPSVGSGSYGSAAVARALSGAGTGPLPAAAKSEAVSRALGGAGSQVPARPPAAGRSPQPAVPGATLRPSSKAFHILARPERAGPSAGFKSEAARRAMRDEAPGVGVAAAVEARKKRKGDEK